MDDSGAARDRRTVTPAILASGAFLAACAVFAVAFVGARGGLEMPVAATNAPVAAASEEPPDQTEPPPSALPTETSLVTAPPITAAPSLAPTVGPTIVPPPTPTPTARPTSAVPTLQPGDPLRALPECHGHPGCVVYTIARFDTLSGIISRYLLDIDVLEALNPGQLSDPGLIRTGHILYLGRDPLARLDPCPSGEACALYVVQSGDSIGEIAARYLMTREAILEANPGLPRPIVEGQVIRLPRLSAG